MGELTPEIEAAYKYVDSMTVHRAEVDYPFPLWHGWVVREAFLAGRRVTPDIQAAAEALVKLDEDTLHNNIPYKDFMGTDDAIALGIKLAYRILGREMPLGDFI